ncbi:hypothetical protein EVAR_74302_1 [Eumeta japonica]|uniref:Uncharacterized protein n=1 Tax=Eumeta variegata TaxID=151549 RepID=A0A4C1SCX7_EUMVA|nr:hypothetical protein EVAR_74302_1 [Eumeta japonica]
MFLKIIPVRVAGPKKEIDTYALLDDGSTVTLIDSDLAQQLGARGRNEPLHIEAIAKTKVEMKTSRCVPIKLRGASNSQQIYARTIENLQLSPQAVTKQDIDGCKHLDDIRHKLMYDQAKPKILIGQDNWHLLVATETRKGHRNQPAASLTPLGWSCTASELVRSDNTCITSKTGIIKPDCCGKNSKQNAEQLRKRHEEVNNYGKKIDRDVELRNKYKEQMKALVNKGYAERAPLHRTENRTWYLPHFPVINAMKPGKYESFTTLPLKQRRVAQRPSINRP